MLIYPMKVDIGHFNQIHVLVCCVNATTCICLSKSTLAKANTSNI